MLLLSMMNQRPSRNVEDGDLTWMAPKFNERVMAGQDYFAKWNATSLPTDPMFQLCTSTAGPTYIGNTKYDDCGDAVAAPVQEDAGVYFASLLVLVSMSCTLELIPCYSGLFPTSHRQTLLLSRYTMLQVSSHNPPCSSLTYPRCKLLFNYDGFLC